MRKLILPLLALMSMLGVAHAEDDPTEVQYGRIAPNIWKFSVTTDAKSAGIAVQSNDVPGLQLMKFTLICAERDGRYQLKVNLDFVVPGGPAYVMNPVADSDWPARIQIGSASFLSNEVEPNSSEEAERAQAVYKALAEATGPEFHVSFSSSRVGPHEVIGTLPLYKKDEVIQKFQRFCPL
ncbi:hypothetical protein HFO45_06830 [Rhizobium leguminosarum]|uniref:hypothetical protein n=1 Tax=Rhizobium leguminosarum TaxID=384 RepID=UPI001C93E8CE|nr:hypothetical protein [Rhizobium leguminosarum]MBY5647971.1 hypothetical protein [Rhizobium leguminosarum]